MPQQPCSIPIHIHNQVAVPAVPQRKMSARLLRTEANIAVDSIALQRRAELGPVLYDIFCESYGALDRDTVCGEIVFRPGGMLYLFRDPTNTIVGFSSISIEAIEIRGRTLGVMQSGIYFRRFIHGGGRLAIRHAIRYLLQEKIKHPFRPLFSMVESLTPASYRAAAQAVPTHFPSRQSVHHPVYADILSTIINKYGLKRSGDHPFVVRYPDPASHAEPERVTLSPHLRDDPDVQFYLDQNPHFADGDILCILIPFNWKQFSQLFSKRLISMVRKG